MCDVLAQAGFRVASASNGFSAVRLARREPLALVVLDLVLPEQSGPSVLAELKATPATARVPVIVISDHPQALRDAVTQADAVIAKPFGTDTLLAEVSRSRRRAGRGRRPLRFMSHILRRRSASEIATRLMTMEAAAFLDL
jgi:DNA-binding response OmpR family regulator